MNKLFPLIIILILFTGCSIQTKKEEQTNTALISGLQQEIS